MIFLDTSLLVAYIVDKDSNHGRAISLINDIVSGKYGSAVTSDYIFDETVTVVLVRTKSMEAAVTSGRLIRESVAILPVGDSVFEKSWNIFKNQRSTMFSFTDCTILALIAENHVDRLATFDGEFQNSDSFKVIDQ